MMRFAELYARLDATTKTNEKIAAIANYLANVDAADAAWAVYFLSGNKLRQLVPTKHLRSWAADQAGIAAWLFDECYQTVGDLAETLALVVPPGVLNEPRTLAEWIEGRLLPLRSLDETEQRDRVLEIWRETPAEVRLVIMKLITGAFRVGVSRQLVTRAIATQFNLAADVVSHRLMGDCKPTPEFFMRVTDATANETLPSTPYPFCLAHPLEAGKGPEPLGSAEEYLAEWKWDGIRGQVIRREAQTFVWSRGEDLMENRWPEIESAAALLPNGTVLDGEILASLNGQVLPFAALQRRIGRKTVGKKLLSEVPVVFYAFDLLEHEGEDMRDQPLIIRRQKLETLLSSISHPHLRATECLLGNTWEDWQAIRMQSREHNAEGLMLKRKDSTYDVGRVRGTWWKWKVAPYTIDAVLLYAQKGHGKRAGLFTDYTFALWDDGKLVPFAKAYSGLDDAEIRQVDRFVREHTTEAFGPVRSVTPKLVMELAFEGLQRSSRHKSGIATRFPRIARWRHDKQPEDANTLSELLELLPEPTE